MAFNFTEMLADPNIQKSMAQMGSGISKGQPAGQFIGEAATDLISNKASQNATQALIEQILQRQEQNPMNEQAINPGLQTQNTQGGMGNLQMENYSGNPQSANSVTPIGQAGKDFETTKTTADGVTKTSYTPSSRNLNTFGTNTPAETQVAQGGQQSPFYQALLG